MRSHNVNIKNNNNNKSYWYLMDKGKKDIFIYLDTIVISYGSFIYKFWNLKILTFYWNQEEKNAFLHISVLILIYSKNEM